MHTKYRWFMPIVWLMMLVAGTGIGKLPVMASETDPVQGEEGEVTYHTDSGTCGANITWKLENGVLTLTGSGAMKDYYTEEKASDSAFDDSYVASTSAPWKGYASEITRIELDDGITKIGSSAFFGLEKAAGELHLPASLTAVGKYAFYHGYSYALRLELPTGLTTIGEFAFDSFAMNQNTWDRTTVSLTFPKSMTSVGQFAFQGYPADKVYIENTAMTIGQNFVDLPYREESSAGIYGAAGSTAEKYAKANGFTFWQWTPGQTHYTVIFDSKGGSEVAVQQVEIGSKVSEPAEPVRTGFYFTGWYLDDVQFDFAEPVHGDATLVAKWDEHDPREVAPVITLENAWDGVILKWDRRSGNGLLRYDIYRALGADGVYEVIGTAGATENSFTHEANRAYERANYHYKLRAVYRSGESETATPDSNIVSTNGLITGDAGALAAGCVGVKITDDQGNILDALTLHVGESSPELHVKLLYQNGTQKDWKDVIGKNSWWWLDWYLGDGGEWRDLGADFNDAPYDYARLLQTADYLASSRASAKIAGQKVMPEGREYYLSVNLQGYNVLLAIPVTVLEAEEGADYGEIEELHACESTEELWAAFRENFKNRKSSFVLAIEPDKWDAAFPDESDITNEMVADKVFDFFADRAGMTPAEGDYLNEGIHAYELTQTETYYENKRYKMIFCTKAVYNTTREQEDWMDETIRKMVDEPGGRFYEYKHGNKTDYEKIKTVYDYVSDELGIKWVNGTNVSIYHMAYSALHDRKGSCQSWALLFYRLTRELGVSSRVLMGTDPGAHTYNIVELGSHYYYVDCSNKRFLQGTKSFKTAPLQQIWCTERFRQNYLAKIPAGNYGGDDVSSIQSVTALTDGQIKAIDANLISTATKMSAGYKISGSAVNVTNIKKTQLQQVYGCSEYLGVADRAAAAKEWGYYLAFRVNVDVSKFAGEAENTGSLTIAYYLDGQRVSQRYTMTDASTLKNGYVDAILKITEETPAISVSVDFDKDAEGSQYQDIRYGFNISALQKQGGNRFGTVKEISDQNAGYGVATSSPLVWAQDSGQNVTVSYDAAAYSMGMRIPGMQADTGYYTALQVNAPEAMKGTDSLRQAVTVAQTADLYYEIAQDNSYVRLFLPVTRNMQKRVELTWAGTQTQTVTVETASDCLLETINARAVLPKSVKFNGLQKTMYVGQTQTADLTVVRKYEQDEVRFVYTSSDSSIVNINRITGVTEALRPGTATITVTLTDGTGAIPIDSKGKPVKGTTASAKITVKAPTAPAGIKLTAVKDTTATVGWKANMTGQTVEVYALPVNKDTMGKAKNNWKLAIETALAAEGMQDRALSGMSTQEQEALRHNLEDRLGVEGCGVFYAAADAKSLQADQLQRATGYVFYLRTVALNRAQELYASGAVSGETKMKTKVLTQVLLEARAADGAFVTTDAVSDGVPVFTIANDSLAGGPEQLTYSVLDEQERTDDTLVYTKAAYKSSNTKVVKVDKKGKLSLAGQAGIAEVYVTGKDSAGAVRESGRIRIRVTKEPDKLANKSTTIAIGASVKLRDLVGYGTKGSTGELRVERIDFAGLLAELGATNCFEITAAADPADTVITAADFLSDAAGVPKAGNSVRLPVSLYAGTTHADGEAAQSMAYATVKVTDMTQPVVTKVTPRDTSVTVKFKPNATVREPDGEAYYYTAVVTDKATGNVVNAVNANRVGENALDACTYRIFIGEDSTEKTPLYTCYVDGLLTEHNYSIQIVAHYDTKAGNGTQGTKRERASAVKNCKTLKPLLTDGSGVIDIHYISLPQLRTTPTAAGERIDYTQEIVLKNNETYVFMAQINRLNRLLGTDKLKWTITSDTKGIATVKATKDTYQAQLNTQRTGTFTVQVTSSVSKEELAVFHVRVVPYQTQIQAEAPEETPAEQVPEETQE